MRDPLRYVVWCGAGHEGVRVPRVRDDARTIACGTLAVLCRTSSALVARGPVVDGGAALVAKPLEDGLVLVVRIATNRLDPRRWRRPPLAPEALGSARRAGRCDREQRRRGARRHRREPCELELADGWWRADHELLRTSEAHAFLSSPLGRGRSQRRLHGFAKGACMPLGPAPRMPRASRTSAVRRAMQPNATRVMARSPEGMTSVCHSSLLLSADAAAQGRVRHMTALR